MKKFVGVSTAVLLMAVSTSAYGMGAKPPASQDSNSGAVNVNQTPTPVRGVVLIPVASKLFPLPNGLQVDLSDELNTMLLTSLTGTNTLQATETSMSQADPCESHLELRAAVTTLELNLVQLGITVGYSPGGILTSGVTNAHGNINVNVGSIGMDFSIWECHGGNCTAILASSANQTAASGNMTFSINFDAITSTAKLVANTDFGKILRSILVNGVNSLATSKHINDLPWQATVIAYSPESGSVVFDAGAQDRIANGQTFTAYTPAVASGSCNVYKPVAYLKTTGVDAVSSTANIEKILDGASKIQAGDVVMVRQASAQ